MSSSPLRELRAEDAEQVAALYVAAHGAARLVDAENQTGAIRLYERAGMYQVGRTDNWVLDV